MQARFRSAISVYCATRNSGIALPLPLARLFVILIILTSTVGVRAENPPQVEPILMIEAAMHTGPIDRIGTSADGRLLVTGAEDKTVRLWSLPDGRLL